MRGKRFLIIDDEQHVADFLFTVIDLEGGSVAVATTASAAVECLRAEAPFDVMVLDLALPDATGWDLLAGSRDLLDGCKVVILSAHLSEDDAQRARDAGVALSLAKPVAAPAMRDALLSVL